MSLKNNSPKTPLFVDKFILFLIALCFTIPLFCSPWFKVEGTLNALYKAPLQAISLMAVGIVMGVLTAAVIGNQFAEYKDEFKTNKLLQITVACSALVILYLTYF